VAFDSHSVYELDIGEREKKERKEMVWWRERRRED
jgi:hypothetical protein